MLRVCAHHEDAEEVLVEALPKAYRHLDRLRDSAAFRSWFARIGRRVCWQVKEREALLPILQLSIPEAEGRELPGSAPTPEVQFARGQMKALLDTGIAALRPLHRSVYELRAIGDRPGDEVARQLATARAATKSVSAWCTRAGTESSGRGSQREFARKLFWRHLCWKSQGIISARCNSK